MGDRVPLLGHPMRVVGLTDEILGAVAGVVVLLVTREVLAWWRPAFPVVLTGQSLTRTAVAAAAMALLAAWFPARRLARLDAASAFRSAR